MKRRNPELEVMIKSERIPDVHKKTSQSGATFGYNLRKRGKKLNYTCESKKANIKQDSILAKNTKVPCYRWNFAS